MTLPRAIGLSILCGTVSSAVGLMFGYIGVPIGLVWTFLPAAALPWGDDETWMVLAQMLFMNVLFFLGFGAILWLGWSVIRRLPSN